jgi:hypothetical protein
VNTLAHLKSVKDADSGQNMLQAGEAYARAALYARIPTMKVL